MELISSIGALIGGALTAIASHFVAHDLYNGAPRYARSLLDRAVRVLPEIDRERYAEEWLAHLHECEGVVGKFRHAIECLLIARKLRQIVEHRVTAEPHAFEFVISSKGRRTVNVTLDVATALPMLKIIQEVGSLEKPIDPTSFVPSQEVRDLMADPDVRYDRLLKFRSAMERALESGQPGFKINIVDEFGRVMSESEMDQWLEENEDED